MISQLGLTPNLHTFGCAAMGCANRFDGLQLLEDMTVWSCNKQTRYAHIVLQLDSHSRDSGLILPFQSLDNSVISTSPQLTELCESELGYRQRW